MDTQGGAQAFALARHAESLELHSFWLPESHFRRGATASPLVGLAALAVSTRKLRLGTTSLLISVHDPRRVARDAITVHRLSGGRLLLGLGRGFERSLFRGLGIDPRSKRDRFDQALDCLLAACTEAMGTIPPLLVAAFGRKGLLQAARRALPYLASPLESLTHLAENLELYRAHLPAGADLGSPSVPVMRTLHVAADASEARRVREAVATELDGLLARGSPALVRAAAGSPEDRLLVGEPREVAKGIARYRDALGMDLLIVRAPGFLPPDAQLRSLTRLREEVLPALGRATGAPGRHRVARPGR